MEEDKNYPDTKELEKIRILLPKGSGVKKAASKAACGTGNIYNILAAKYKSKIVIKACLDVIKEDANDKIVFVKKIRDKMRNN